VKLTHGHVADLVKRGCKWVFFPQNPIGRKESPSSSEHLTCSLHAGYSVIIRNNMDLAAKGVTLLDPTVVCSALSLVLGHTSAQPTQLPMASSSCL